MQSCEFSLTMILFILLLAIPILVGFLKKIAWQNMLMVHINKKSVITCVSLFLPCSYLYHIWLFPRLMHLSGDIEKNPGPKKGLSQMFSIGRWNLNSIVAYNSTKVALIKAYSLVQRLDIFCISERGNSKSKFVEEERGGRSLKSEQKRTGRGGFLTCMYVRFFKKIC